MFNVLSELFLSTYFLFDAIAGKLSEDKTTLFNKLYGAFLLPEEQREELFSATQAEVVREIVTYGDYAQICRIQKFSELSECEGVPSEHQEMIAIKGGALKKMKQIGFDEFAEGTEASICKFLTETANMGLLPSLCMLGFLQCEGIFVPKNETLGRKNLEKAAQWNSVEGILLALYYNGDDRQKNGNRLYTVTRGTLYDGVCEAAKAAYALQTVRKVPANRLLQKAFGAGVLKSEVYAPQYARFIFSEFLSIRDRERVLFSGQKEAISETADLPLKLSYGFLAFQAQALEELPLARGTEQDRILESILNADLRGDAAYCPLCISSDSEYLIGLYLTALSEAFPSAHVEKIDVADLNEYDFEPTKNNVFVRSCDEDSQNVYLLCFKGDIREGVLNAVKNFLQSDKRKKFRLQHPGAVIDLSSVLPVCFCDRQNARLLKPYCDVVALAPVSTAEKTDLLTYILQSKARQYKKTSVKTDGNAHRLLTGYSVDRAESLIDRAVRRNRTADELIITEEMLKELAGADMGARNKYGFGGAGNESK